MREHTVKQQLAEDQLLKNGGENDGQKSREPKGQVHGVVELIVKINARQIAQNIHNVIADHTARHHQGLRHEEQQHKMAEP